MGNREWKYIDVDNLIKVPFEWRDPDTSGKSLGRAEFFVSIKFRRGKLTDIWIYPSQLHMDTVWHLPGNEHDNFLFQSYDNLEPPGVWFMCWHEHHKCPAVRVYAPRFSNLLWIEPGGMTFLRVAEAIK